MSDVINGVPRELLERVRDLCKYWFTRENRSGMSESEYKTWHALGFSSNAYTELRALLTAQPQAKQCRNPMCFPYCDCDSVDATPQASAAQSAPAGEREDWSRFDPTFLLDHLRRETNFDADLIGRMLQAAAWQRTQSAGVPEGWPLKVMRHSANKIYERVDAAAALYESGKSGLGFMEDAAESALYLRNTLDDMLAAAPAQPAAQDQGEVPRLREASEAIREFEKSGWHGSRGYHAGLLKAAQIVDELDASTGKEV